MLRFLRCAVVCTSVLLVSRPLRPDIVKSGKAHGKPASHTTDSNNKGSEPLEKEYVLVANGPFGVLRDEGVCGTPAGHTCTVALLVNRSVIEATGTLLDDSRLLVRYRSLAGVVVPTELMLGEKQKSVLVPYVAEGSSTTRLRQALLAGDFCQPLKTKQLGQSTTEPQAATVKCSSALFQQDGKTVREHLTGYVQGVNGVNTTPVHDIALERSAVSVSFTADPDFRPVWLVLQARADGLPAVSVKVPYNEATPSADTSAVYSISEIAKVCGPNGQQPTAVPKECSASTLFTLTPLSPGVIGEVEQLARQGELLFTRMRTYSGILPSTLAVMNDTGQSTLARLLTRPNAEQSDLDVHLTVMDQETMRRNYGAGLAETYLAVKLDLVNRTEKKLQFNKSAVWFDADFVETSSKYKERFRNKASNGTFDMVAANVYDTPFSANLCSDTPLTMKDKEQKVQRLDHRCKQYKFGIDQTQRFYADGPLSILGSFDYLTQRTDRALRLVELFGSVLTTLATGGPIAQVNNTAFRDATAVLTGTFLPGTRGIVMNTAEINRQRANLVAQTFGDTVQIAAHATAATIVLLPREALIGVNGYEKLVLLDKLIDVHIDPDVVNGVKDPPIPAGKLALGYTKSQVRQALGEPQAVQTTPDDTSTFSYTQGPYQSVNFNKDGQAITWMPRSLTDQLNVTPTLSAAKDVLKANASTGRELTLLDNSVILVDVPGVSTVERYDTAGKRLGTYTLLYDSINAGKGKTKLEFEKMLGQMKLPAAQDKMLPTQVVQKKDAWTTYDMPDIKGGTMRVDFDAIIGDSKEKDGAKVKDITFTGAKPGIQ